MPYNPAALPALLRNAGTANGVAIAVPQDSTLRAELNVTASSAPTTLDVKIEHSNDSGATWVKLKSFTQVGAVASAFESIEINRPTSGIVRATSVLVGTSYTFSVSLRWY